MTEEIGVFGLWAITLFVGYAFGGLIGAGIVGLLIIFVNVA